MAGEGMLDDLAFSKDETVYSVDFTYTLANVDSAKIIVNDTTTNTVSYLYPYAVAPIFPGDVITVADVVYNNGFLPSAPTATGFASVAGGRYTVGDTACSLDIAGAPIPLPTVSGCVAYTLVMNNTYQFQVQGGVITNFTLNGVAVVPDMPGIYTCQVTSPDDVIEIAAAPYVARVDPSPDPENMVNNQYISLNEAVAAAAAGAEVTLLTNCTVSAPIVFSNAITLVNNRFDVSIEAPYAFRFANGTNTPVTISQYGTFDNQGWGRTGAFIWNAGAGSPFLVGSNEVKGDYGITDTYSGSLVVNDVTIAAGNMSNGNLVKIENGTFSFGGMGLISGGTRCVKADADAGDFTALVTIDGGVISNTTGSAAIAATAKGGTGTAAVTIKNGTIYGPIVEDGTTGTAKATISGPGLGAGMACFDRDQTAFCEEGCETVLSYTGFYAVQRIWCNVYFNVDGINVHTQQVYWGDYAYSYQPENKNYHVFDHWYVSDESEPYDFANTPVASRELTLYAKYVPYDWPIAYYDYGTATEITGLSPTNYFYGTGVAELPTPEKANCTFDGWYIGPAGEERIYSIPADSTGQVMLYAKFTENTPQQSTFTLELDAEGGVKGAKYIVNGGNVTNEVGYAPETIEFTPGDIFLITKVDYEESIEWYVADGDFREGYAFQPEAGNTYTIGARKIADVNQSNDNIQLPANTSPADVGVESGTFSGPGTSTEKLAEVLTWAKGYNSGASVKEIIGLVNELNFSDLQETPAEQAYLLNCSADELADKKAAFKFESFDPGNLQSAEDAFAALKAANGYNGTVKILGAIDIEGPYIEDPVAEARFFKAVLTVDE